MTPTVIVFARHPAPGEAKTRLQPALSAEQAAAAYEAFLRDVVDRAGGTGLPVRIRYVDAPGADDWFAASFPGLDAGPQVAGDLGARMAGALAEAIRDGASAAIVIGSDSPTFPPDRLLAAAEALRHADLVYGPTDDGGYYLVGVPADAWPAAGAVFEGIPWSTPDVLAESLRRADAARLDVHLLPRWYDIDEAADLERAARDAEPGSHLARWLRGWGGAVG